MRKIDASIKLAILKSKEKDGKVPVVVRGCYACKQKTKYTEVYISAKNWDAKNERITSKERNSAKLNKTIQEVKNKILNRLDDCISKGITYDLNLLFDIEQDVKGSNDLVVLSERLISERRLKFGTVCIYNSTFKSLEEFNGHIPTIDQITKDFLVKWRNWLVDEKQLGINTIKSYFERLKSLMNWAVENEIIQVSQNPFYGYNYLRGMKATIVHKALTEDQLNAIICYYISLYDIDPVSMAYRLKKPQRKTKYVNQFSALEFFLIIYYFQGLSPKDVILLKKNQIKEVVDKNEETNVDEYYIEIEGVCRSKTQKAVVISFNKTYLISILLDKYIDSEGEYLFPFLNDEKNRDDAKIRAFISNINASFKVAIDKVNKYITDNNKDVELIDKKTCTLYSARHLFASLSIRNGVTLPDLAIMMGRSIQNMDTYIRSFTTADDVRKIRANYIDKNF